MVKVYIFSLLPFLCELYVSLKELIPGRTPLADTSAFHDNPARNKLH